MSPFMADIVAKRFCASDRATLIQNQAPIRNVDSKIHSFRFDCCAFLPASCSSPTFATISALSGLAEMVCKLSALRGEADMRDRLTSTSSVAFDAVDGAHSAASKCHR